MEVEDYICTQLFYNLEASKWFVLDEIHPLHAKNNLCPFINSAGDYNRLVHLLNIHFKTVIELYDILSKTFYNECELILNFIFLDSRHRFIRKYRKITHKIDCRRRKLAQKILYKRVLQITSHQSIGKLLYAIMEGPVVQSPSKYNIQLIDDQPYIMTFHRIRAVKIMLNY